MNLFIEALVMLGSPDPNPGSDLGSDLGSNEQSKVRGMRRWDDFACDMRQVETELRRRYCDENEISLDGKVRRIWHRERRMPNISRDFTFILWNFYKIVFTKFLFLKFFLNLISWTINSPERSVHLRKWTLKNKLISRHILYFIICCH